MSGDERRKQILHILKTSPEPVSGNRLAKLLGVSRQVIVQDIALLRANSVDIFSGNSGYILHTQRTASRVFKVIHSDEDSSREMTIIVDLGGWIKDVFIYHKVYKVVQADINIHSRADIERFMDDIHSGKSSLLKNVTSGYHYHTVLADDDQTLDRIQTSLADAGFLAPLQDYEPVDFWTKE